jgi:hypothetical protein
MYRFHEKDGLLEYRLREGSGFRSGIQGKVLLFLGMFGNGESMTKTNGKANGKIAFLPTTERSANSELVWMEPKEFIRTYTHTGLRERIVAGNVAKLRRGERIHPLQIVYKDGVIKEIDGLHRALASIKLRIKKVPVELVGKTAS